MSPNENIVNIVIFAVIASIVGYAFFRFLPRLIERIFEKSPGLNRIDKTIPFFLADLLGIGLIVFAIISVLQQLPESATIIAVVITVASGAFIFTSEGWVGDAFAGISLLAYPQFKIDNWVTIGDNKRGKVVRLGLFRTKLETLSLDVISVRNAKVLAEDIINHSGIFLRQIRVVVHTAGYGDFGEDIHAYKAEVLSIAERVQDEICPEARETGRMPKVFFTEFGGSSDHITVIYYAYDKDEAYGAALDAIHTAMAATLRPSGVVLGQVNATTIDNLVQYQPVEQPGR